MLAYNIGYVANVLPIPSGVGVLGAGSPTRVLYGVSAADAAAVLVYEAIVLWSPARGGLLAYTRLRPAC